MFSQGNMRDFSHFDFRSWVYFCSMLESASIAFQFLTRKSCEDKEKKFRTGLKSR
jgi:hypothetical protein